MISSGHVDRTAGHRDLSPAFPAQLQRAGGQGFVRAQGRLQLAVLSPQHSLLGRYGSRYPYHGEGDATLQCGNGAASHVIQPGAARSTTGSGRILGAQADGDHAALEDPATAGASAGRVSHEDRVLAPRVGRRARARGGRARVDPPLPNVSRARAALPRGGSVRAEDFSLGAAHRDPGARHLRSQVARRWRRGSYAAA